MLGISYCFKGIQMETAWFHEDALSRQAANSFYAALKTVPDVTDIRTVGGKTSAPQTKIALVAFKLYGYEVPADTKERDIITVLSGGQPIQMEVLRMTDARLPGVTYIPAEEVIRK